MMKMMTWEENLQENQRLGHQMEMSVFRKNETGLPVNVWFDQGDSCQKNGQEKQIRFQNDKSNKCKYNNTLPMSISDDPEIMNENTTIEISQHDINLIKEFVKINKDILLNLNSIGIIEFSKQMKRIDG